MQWSLVLLLFWPVLRGMPWERFRGELGWHRGRGVWREIGCGILGYLAGLPIYFGMAVIVLAANLIAEAVKKAAAGGKTPPEVPLPDNKVFDLVTGANGWMLLLLASLIVIWAPIVEESVFRGALFRHLRQRLRGPGGLIASVVLVAAAFGIAHAYVLVGVIMVATLGGIFAAMRDWRGSLIAPMTAHCLHNSMVLLLLLTVLPLMKG
jgi:membrane protease YdiL (CAAX protease family)